VYTASGIAKPILLPAAIEDEMERSSISSSIAINCVTLHLVGYILEQCCLKVYKFERTRVKT